MRMLSFQIDDINDEYPEWEDEDGIFAGILVSEEDSSTWSRTYGVNDGDIDQVGVFKLY